MNPSSGITPPRETCLPTDQPSLAASAAYPSPNIDAGISQSSCDNVAAGRMPDAHFEQNKSPPRREEIPAPRVEIPPERSRGHVALSTPPQRHRYVEDAAVSEDSEDEFVFMLQNAKSTTQAIEMIRRIQCSRRFTETALSSRACSSNSLDTNDKLKGSDSSASQCSRLSEGLKQKGQQVVELPETILDFQTAPPYTVSLTTSRDAVFEDALSGFRSYLEQEDRKIEAYHQYSLRRSAQEQGLPISYKRTFSTQNGLPCVSAVPVYASGCDKVHAMQGRPQCHSSPSYPDTFRQTQRCSRPSNDSTPERNPLNLSEILETQMQGQSQKCHMKPPNFLSNELSEFNVQEKGDEHAVAKANTPLGNGAQFQVFPYQQEEGLSINRLQHYLTDKEGEVGCLKNDTNRHPQLGDPDETREQISDPQPNNRNEGTSKANHEDEQQLVDLVEQEFLRMQAPQLFRYRHPLEPWVATEQGNRVSALRTALYASRSYLIHQYHGSSSYININLYSGEEKIDESGHISGPLNRVRREWVYVWEQFKRDIHREVLLIEDANYRDPNKAVAAIISYLEYCYDRGQSVYLKRKAEAEEAERFAREAQRNEGGGLFSSFFREGAAIIKETVENAQKTLSDLLSVTGLDPVSRRPTVVYPKDPLTRAVKIFDAAREVILASQQSFIGFPYQLLCEQLGTTRLPVALEEFIQKWGMSEEDVSSIPLRETDGSTYLSRDAEQSGYADGLTSKVIRTTGGPAGRDDSADAASGNTQLKEMQRRNRERRRRKIREEKVKRLPLLVGEPHPDEFKAFVSRVRSRVASMNAKDTCREGKASKRNKESLNSESDVAASIANASNPREACFTSNLQQEQDDFKSNWFREDVGSSVYLIPIDHKAEAQSCAANEFNGNESKESVEQGVRIHLYFHKLRNVPVICVSKLFRLLTVPGFELSPASSSESLEAVNLKNDDRASFKCFPLHEEAKKEMPNTSVFHNTQQLPVSLSTARCKQEKSVKKSLLILIQVQFSLFTDEEAEVRWKWYHV